MNYYTAKWHIPVGISTRLNDYANCTVQMLNLVTPLRNACLTGCYEVMMQFRDQIKSSSSSSAMVVPLGNGEIFTALSQLTKEIVQKQQQQHANSSIHNLISTMARNNYPCVQGSRGDAVEFMGYLLTALHDDTKYALVVEKEEDEKEEDEKEEEIQSPVLIEAALLSQPEQRMRLAKSISEKRSQHQQRSAASSSICRDVFRSQIYNMVCCHTCGTNSMFLNEANYFSVDLDTVTTPISLDKLIFNEQTEKYLNSYYCSKCPGGSNSHSVSITQALTRFPPYLLVHLKRLHVCWEKKNDEEEEEGKIYTYLDTPIQISSTLVSAAAAAATEEAQTQTATTTVVEYTTIGAICFNTAGRNSGRDLNGFYSCFVKMENSGGGGGNSNNSSSSSSNVPMTTVISATDANLSNRFTASAWCALRTFLLCTHRQGRRQKKTGAPPWLLVPCDVAWLLLQALQPSWYEITDDEVVPVEEADALHRMQRRVVLLLLRRRREK